jgi:hypothetical protein
MPRAAPRLLGQLWGAATPAAPAEATKKTKRARLAELETEPAPTDVWAEPLVRAAAGGPAHDALGCVQYGCSAAQLFAAQFLYAS